MMKIRILLVVFFALHLNIYSQVPEGYYSSAEGLTGEELKTELYNIIDGHNAQSYGALWNHLQYTDAKDNGKVWDMYSDIPGGEPPYEYTFVTHQCGNYSNEGDCYNREHSFPKSWFNDGSPMYTDMFHIVPTDGYVNGQRGNYPYGETSNPDWTSLNGTKRGSCSYPGYSGTVFEPIDEYKGDFARSYFYMVTRYEDQVANWENNESGADAMLNGTSYPAFEEWAIDMLIEWHNDDPISQKELDRNDAIYEIQGNRNPFIDHPEYVNKIWGDQESENVPPAITDIETVPANPNPEDEVNIRASITDQDGTISSAEVDWGLSSVSMDNMINMSDKGDYYQSDDPIPAQTEGTTVYFRISATDDSSATTTSDILSYTVEEKADTVLSEDFSACPPENWTLFSVSGSEDWICDQENSYMEINAYGGNEASDDWLITPALNLNDYDGEVLNFETWTRYADSFYPPLEVKYSVNYSEGESPSEATWNNLSCELSAEDSETWTNSGDIDLSNIIGEDVHIAFHYTSSGTGGSTSSWWKVDNVQITGSVVSEDEPPVIDTVYTEPEYPGIEESFVVYSEVYDDNVVEEVKIFWGNSSGTYDNESQMQEENGTYSREIPAQSAGTEIYFVVEAIDDNGQSVQSEEYHVSYPDSEDAPVIDTVTYSPVNPKTGDPVAVYASIESSSTMKSVELHWGNSSNTYPNTLPLRKVGAYYSDSIPGQEDVAKVYFVVEATNTLDSVVRSDEYVIEYEETSSVFSDKGAGTEDSVKIYPVPAREKIFVEFLKTQRIYTIRIHDVKGKLMKSEKFSEGVSRRASLNIAELETGVYIFEITTSQGRYFKNILIK
ncbi:MAG: endonuclease [Bacteroidales bacterium]